MSRTSTLPKLASRGDIARLAGCTPKTVDNWRERHVDTFPVPRETAAGPIWAEAEIRAWLRDHRPAIGRPRVSA